MDPTIIAQVLLALANVATEGMKLYEESKQTLSSSDAAAIHDALLKAEAATAALRPKVDAALEAAAQK